MTHAEYLATQQAILAIAGIAAELNTEEFLQRINRAEAFGPVLDPTLWRKAARDLSLIKDLAEAVALLKLRALEAKALARSKS